MSKEESLPLISSGNDELDLSGFECENRRLLHFSLALKKNLQLKRRKPCVCACEILKPPIFMLILLIGYFAADMSFEDPKNYAELELVDINYEVQQTFCISNQNASQPNPLHFPECVPSLGCLFGLKIKDSNGFVTDSEICWNWNITQLEVVRSLIHNSENPFTIPMYDSILILQNLDSTKHRGVIEIAAKNCTEGYQLMNHLRNTTMLFDTFFNHNSTHRDDNNPCPGLWTSEDDAVDYLKDEGADKTWALLVLNDMDWGTNHFDYTIRMNRSSTPHTSRIKDKFVQGLGSDYLKYFVYGFLSIQDTVDHYLLGEDVSPDIIATPMPTWSYRKSEFFDRAGSMIPLVLSLSFLYPISCLVGGIVEEKELRLRESMLIMGLSKSSFFFSWYCSYWILTTISCIIITIISKTTFLQHTSGFLIFLVFELFAMSIVSMGLLISVFFSKSRIAAIFAPLMMFITVVPKFAIPEGQTLTVEVVTSFLSPVAFSYSTELITNYEGSGEGSSFVDLFADDYSYFLSMFMMSVDTILYLVLAWYLDAVLPSEYGIKKHPLYFLSPIGNLFKGLFRKPYTNLGKGPSNGVPPTRIPEFVDTQFDSVTRSKLADRERVNIRGLRKEFRTEQGLNIAVNNLGNGLPAHSLSDGLSFYEGQIQCILGHNGAGKTTLINMLTGMIVPTSGDAFIWGKSITTDMDLIRKDLGFCPQHNILWPMMSCEEHLRFYGRIKGVPEDVLSGPNGRIEKMLKLVNLFEKRKAWSSVLSGGQKRKLSVACSLVGGSKLVFLDEPTAGMDVESRRAMWSLLRNPNILSGRVVVLTTHYMDEADLLGDSIAIMNKGCLHSWGSPFFLKTQMGVGYNMSIAMNNGADPDAVEALIRNHLTSCNPTRISCTGNELRMRLPTERSVSSSESKKYLTSRGWMPSTSGAKDFCESYLVNHPQDSTIKRILDETRTPKLFPTLFDDLDSQKESLKISGYGVSVTTLEEVFMKISTDTEEDISGDSPAPVAMQPSGDTFEDRTNVTVSPTEDGFGQLYSIIGDHPERDLPKKGMPLFTEQFGALLYKKFHYARRDRRTMCFQFVLPVVFIGMALLLGRLRPPQQPEKVLSVEMYDLPLQVPFGGVNGSAKDHFFDVSTNCSASECLWDPSLYRMKDYGVETNVELSTILLQQYNSHPHTTLSEALTYPGRAITNSTDTIEILYNTTYLHALPVALNGIHNAVLRNSSSPGSKPRIVARNHPLPFSNYIAGLINDAMVLFTGIFIMIPFTFIPSNFVSFIVKERECKAKHVQIVSGVHLGAYWTSSFVSDLVAYFCTMVLAFLLFLADGRSEFIGSSSVFFATFLLFLLYGISSIACSYLMSFMFNSHTQAQNMLMVFNFFAGFILVITSHILDLIDSTMDANKYLKYIYRIVPSYCLGEGIIALSGKRLQESLNLETDGPFAWDMIGSDLTYMSGMAPIFFLACVLFEVPSVRRFFKSLIPNFSRSQMQDSDRDAPHSSDPSNVSKRRGAWLQCTTNDGSVYYFNELTGESKYSDKDTPFYVDGAVTSHEYEINNESRSNDFVTVQHLRKVWPPAGNMTQPKVAVSDLSFGVESGELFAFLGTNGAGKTTTLSVLSGEYLPTSGVARIGHNPETGKGYDVVKEAQLARQSLGFCPQFDALLDQLTVREHLQLYARLRGVPKHHQQHSIKVLVTGLGLTPHLLKTAKSLSGGNRRKLSVAIALMGGPPVVFLDEPSAGMDPIARRGLWCSLEKAITELKLSVILTTHHLEEIEGLSNLNHRITIMVDGRLQCLGNLSQLKQSLGGSYELTVKVAGCDAEEQVRNFITTTWSQADLTENTQQRLTYQILKSEAKLSSLFEKIEGNRHLGITDYSINETSLEQVFMRISERAVRDEDALTYADQSKGQKLHKPTPPSTGRPITVEPAQCQESNAVNSDR